MSEGVVYLNRPKGRYHPSYAAFKAFAPAAIAGAELPAAWLDSRSTYIANYLTARGPLGPSTYGASAFLYRSDNPAGRIAQTAYLSPQYRFKDLSPADIKALEDEAARLGRASLYAKQISQMMRLGVDVTSIYMCLSNDTCGDEVYGVGIDAGSTVTKVASNAFAFKGFNGLRGGNLGTAIPNFGFSRGLGVGAGALQMVAGVAKLGIETSYYMETGDFNGSAFILGGLDVLSGIADSTYSGYVLGKAVGPITQAAQVNALAYGIIPQFSGKVLLVSRVAGGAGAVFGMASSGWMIVDGLSNENISADERERRVISGSFGFTGSTMMLASALMITPGTQFLGVLFFAGGLLFLAVQSVYDHYDEIKHALLEDRRDGERLALRPRPAIFLSDPSWFMYPTN